MRTDHVRPALLGIALLAGACATTQDKVTLYTPGGQVTEETSKTGDRVTSELHRIFDTTVLRGEGMFENANEGLARQSAISLAQADLAQKVQSEVRGNTVVMNNTDVRSVVETNVNAIVRNYDIDSAGYDPNSTRYRVRISVKGEQVVKEIERHRTQRFGS
jgi:hypothetical protein